MKTFALDQGFNQRSFVVKSLSGEEMRLSENTLFMLANLLYQTDMAHTQEMKNALSNTETYDRYRSERRNHILTALCHYSVDIFDKIVVDFGCSDGALSQMYLEKGAQCVIGLDIDRKAIDRAKSLHPSKNISFCQTFIDRIPLADESVDRIISYDVFEHISYPSVTLEECYRILRPGGKLLIGTWGWYHPFAPHLWSTMPVPWCHIFFSERTILRVCRRVYHSSWYIPTMHDLDDNLQKLPHRYESEEISTEYLNKLLIRDFREIFRKSRFDYQIHLVPFSSRYARWTRVFLNLPYIQEFITSYFWAVLTKS